MSAPPTLTVPSLGGGVQSSVMALMAGEGAFDRVPDCAILPTPDGCRPASTSTSNGLPGNSPSSSTRDRWITNRYPLIEAGRFWRDCAEWWAACYDRPLKRSACVACPFQSRQRWVETKRRWPELFAETVEVDDTIRGGRTGSATSARGIVGSNGSLATSRVWWTVFLSVTGFESPGSTMKQRTIHKPHYDCYNPSSSGHPCRGYSPSLGGAMFHGLDNRYLYVAYQLTCTFVDPTGNKITCTGTGFWVRANDNKMILVTNRHVLDLESADVKYAGFKLHQLRVSGKANDPSSGLPDVNCECLIVGGDLKHSKIPENDIACLVNPSVITLDGSPAMNIEFWISHDLLATGTDFESKFSICDFVAFPGYPEWHDKLQQRPILRTGTIFSDPRYDYSQSQYMGECVAYEAFSYGGSSGSPVFAVQKGPKPGAGLSFPGFRELKLIGINAGHLPASNGTHSGISYMYKSSAILDIIEGH